MGTYPFFHSHANETLSVSREKAEFVAGDKSVVATIDVELTFLPTARLRFVAELDGIEPLAITMLPNWDNVNLKFLNHGTEFEVLIARASFSSSTGKTELVAIPTKEPAQIGPPDEEVSEIKFGLTNFPEFFGESHVVTEEDGSGQRLGHSVIFVPDWKITITTFNGIRSLLEELRASGGYALTHLVTIEREDGTTFKASDAQDLLSCLRYFLSFSRGYWVGMVIPTGFDGNDSVVWQQWGVTLADPVRGFYVPSWFDEMNTKLSEVFPGFWRRWQLPEWKKPLQEAVYWYLRSNTNAVGSDGSVILSFTALELMAWIYTVQDKKMLSQDGFERLPAADRIRLLLATLRVPCALPDSLVELGNIARAENWEDSAQALSEIRNAIVHPSRKTRQRIMGAIHEAWTLSQWLLELLVLCLSDYQGQYANRVQHPKWRGQVEDVPYKRPT